MKKTIGTLAALVGLGIATACGGRHEPESLDTKTVGTKFSEPQEPAKLYIDNKESEVDYHILPSGLQGYLDRHVENAAEHVKVTQVLYKSEGNTRTFEYRLTSNGNNLGTLTHFILDIGYGDVRDVLSETYEFSGILPGFNKQVTLTAKQSQLDSSYPDWSQSGPIELVAFKREINY